MRHMSIVSEVFPSLGVFTQPRVSFGRHVMETNAHLTISAESRLEDLRDALTDASVKGILAVTGGSGAVQILNRLDFGLFE